MNFTEETNQVKNYFFFFSNKRPTISGENDEWGVTIN